MDGWKRFIGKKVYVRLKNNRNYSGIVQSVDEAPPLFFINLIDKFSKPVTILHSEILEIKEER